MVSTNGTTSTLIRHLESMHANDVPSRAEGSGIGRPSDPSGASLTSSSLLDEKESSNESSSLLVQHFSRIYSSGVLKLTCSICSKVQYILVFCLVKNNNIYLFIMTLSIDKYNYTCYLCVLQWKDLPAPIRFSSSIPTFCNALKTHQFPS